MDENESRELCDQAIKAAEDVVAMVESVHGSLNAGPDARKWMLLGMQAGYIGTCQTLKKAGLLALVADWEQ